MRCGRMPWLLLGLCLIAGPAAGAEKAPGFTLASMEGKMVSLADYRGKVVFIDFWATWCPPCRRSIPAVARLHERFRGSDVVVLGINLDNDPVKLNRFIERTPALRYPVLVGNDSLSAAYGIDGIPAFFIIDRNGMIVKRQSGFGESWEEEWVAVLQRLSAGRGAGGGGQ